jgi:hypothetical protein
MIANSPRRLARFAALGALALAACASGDPAAPPMPCAAAGIPGTCRAACGAYDTGTAADCSGGLLCCTPAVAAACDSSVTPQPNTGLAEDGGERAA